MDWAREWWVFGLGGGRVRAVEAEADEEEFVVDGELGSLWDAEMAFVLRRFLAPEPGVT